MCGLVGAVWRDGRTIGEAEARAATDALAHRGPDAEACHIAPGLFLGHRRLAIIDLDERSTQPFTIGPLTMVYNGEIYNYREVKERLVARGAKFRTTSDTEVLLTAFQYDGIGCLTELEGMFAFAIHDAEAGTLTLGRDRFGEKPLVYFHDEERLIFGSEVPPVTDLAGAETLALDPYALSLYFRFSYIPAPFGPYRGMRQLPPGHWARIDLESWKLEEGCYYTPRPAKTATPGFEAAKTELRRRLSDSVLQRLEASDVPVATFLSGGIDSSIVSLLAARHASSGITAYSVGFPDDPEFDESGFARAVVARDGAIRHRVIDMREDDLIGFADTTLAHLGEPYADASLIPTAFLCSHVEEKVILGGDGADEVFAGYGVYSAMMASARLPSWIKRLSRLLPAHTNPVAIANPRLRALELFRSHMQPTMAGEYLSWRSYCGDADLSALGLDSDAGRDMIAELFGAARPTLSDLLAADMQFNMPADMLKKVDLASMQHALEVRLPYLDSGLVEWVLSLPPEFLMQGRVRKHLLREAFREDLPPEILTRGKMGFLLPIRKWFRSGRMREELLGLADAQTTFDSAVVARLVKEHADGRFDHSPLLWALLVFFKWQLRYPAGAGSSKRPATRSELKR